MRTLEPDTDNSGVGRYITSKITYEFRTVIIFLGGYMKTKDEIHALSESAILIALATVLSIIKLEMPLGGSVTLASMLPICVISIRRGIKKGFFAAFIYSIIQLLLGIVSSGILAWGLDIASLIGCFFLDYLCAFTILGISGLFRKKGIKGIILGITLAFFLRFFFHVLSGCIIFNNLEQWSLFNNTFVNKPVLYSICYNGCFMLPELLITYIVVFIMSKIPKVKDGLIK